MAWYLVKHIDNFTYILWIFEFQHTASRQEHPLLYLSLCGLHSFTARWFPLELVAGGWYFPRLWRYFISLTRTPSRSHFSDSSSNAFSAGYIAIEWLWNLTFYLGEEYEWQVFEKKVLRKMALPQKQELNKVKVKLFLCLTKHHAIEMYWGVEV